MGATGSNVTGGGKGKGKEREWTEFENPYRLKAELNQRESIRRGGNQIAKRPGPVGLGLSFGEELANSGKGQGYTAASFSGESGRMGGQKAAMFGGESTGMRGQKAASFGGERAPRVTGMGGQKATSFGGIGNREFIDLTSDEDN
jgi:hypothetical protein